MSVVSSADISCWCQQGQRLRWSKLRQRAVPRQGSRCCSADALICSCPAAFNYIRVSRLPGNPPMIEGWRTSSGLQYLFWRRSSVPQEQWIITPSLWHLYFNYLFWVCPHKTIFLMEISACIRGWESFSFLSMSNNNLKILFVTLITAPFRCTCFISRCWAWTACLEWTKNAFKGSSCSSLIRTLLSETAEVLSSLIEFIRKAEKIRRARWSTWFQFHQTSPVYQNGTDGHKLAQRYGSE